MPTNINNTYNNNQTITPQSYNNSNNTSVSQIQSKNKMNTTQNSIKDENYWNKYYGSSYVESINAAIEEYDLSTEQTNQEVSSYSQIYNEYEECIESLEKMYEDKINEYNLSFSSNMTNIENEYNIVIANVGLTEEIFVYNPMTEKYEKVTTEEWINYVMNEGINFDLTDPNSPITIVYLEDGEVSYHVDYKKLKDYYNSLSKDYIIDKKSDEYEEMMINYKTAITINEYISFYKSQIPQEITTTLYNLEEVQSFLKNNWKNNDGTTPTIYEIYQAQIKQVTTLDDKLKELGNYLSEEELGVYLYIYETEGQAAALSYVDMFEDRKKNLQAIANLSKDIEEIISWPNYIQDYSNTLIEIVNYISENYDESTMNWETFLNDNNMQLQLEELAYNKYIYENYPLEISFEYWKENSSNIEYINNFINNMKETTDSQEFINFLLTTEQEITEDYIKKILNGQVDPVMKGNLNTLLQVWANGLTQGMLNQFNIIKNLTSTESSSQDLRNAYYAQIIASSKLLNIAYQVGNSEGAMLPSMYLGILGQAEGATTGVLQAIFNKYSGSIWYMTSMTTTTYHEEIINGTPVGRAIIDALISSALETGAERLIGVIPGLSEADDTISTSAKEAIKTWLRKGASEGAEEFIQPYIMAGVNAILYGETLDLESLTEESFTSALVGAIVGLTFGVGSLSYEKSLTIKLNDNTYTCNATLFYEFLIDHPDATRIDIESYIANNAILVDSLDIRASALATQLGIEQEIAKIMIIENCTQEVAQIIHDLGIDFETAKKYNDLGIDFETAKKYNDLGIDLTILSELYEFTQLENGISKQTLEGYIDKILNDYNYYMNKAIEKEAPEKLGIPLEAYNELPNYQKTAFEDRFKKLQIYAQEVAEASINKDLKAAKITIIEIIQNFNNGLYDVTIDKVLEEKTYYSQNQETISTKEILGQNGKDYTKYFPSVDYFISNKGVVEYTKSLLDSTTIESAKQFCETQGYNIDTIEGLGEFLAYREAIGQPVTIKLYTFQTAKSGANNYVTFNGNIGQQGNTQQKGFFSLSVEDLESASKKYPEIFSFNEQTGEISIHDIEKFGQTILGGVEFSDDAGIYLISQEITLNSNLSMPSVSNGNSYLVNNIPGGMLPTTGIHEIVTPQIQVATEYLAPGDYSGISITENSTTGLTTTSNYTVTTIYQIKN